MKKGCVILLFLSLVGVAWSQREGWEFSLTGSYMTPNNFNMIEYSAGTVGLEAGWWYRAEGEEWWIQRRRNPSFGVRGSFAYIPQSIAGHRLGIEGVVSAPLGSRFEYYLGVGLSGYTRSQYFTHDEENIFITTLVSCLIDVGINYRLTDHVSLSAALLHSSNGMLQRPNKGLNYIQGGLRYSLKPTPRVENGEVLPPPDFSRHELGFTLQGGAVVSRDLNQEGYFPCYDISLNYQYYFDPVLAVGGTLDLWYNGSHYGLSRMYGEYYTFPCYVSTLGFVEGFWGPVSVKAGIGPVLVAPPRVNIRFYERVGAYYNFGHHYLGVSLNAHAGMIEFIEWSYGYRIPLGK